MDDQNGKKAACWKKRSTISPGFQQMLEKLEEVKKALEEEQRILKEEQLRLQQAEVQELDTLEVEEFDVSDKVSDG